VKTEFENSVDDCEAAEAENRALVQNLQDKLHNLVKENEELKLVVETKNDEINDLEKSNKVKTEVSNNLRKELYELKMKVTKEKHEMMINHKTEIKYWRKELGNEEKQIIQLREKLAEVENSEIVTPATKEIKSKKKKGGKLRPLPLSYHS